MLACEPQPETWCSWAKSSAAEAICHSMICGFISGWAAMSVSIRPKSCGRTEKRKRSPIWLLIAFMWCVKGREWSPAIYLSIASSSLNMIVGVVNRLRAVLLFTALLAAGANIRAQNTTPPAESPLTRQFHQSLSLAQHGDRQEAMKLVLRLLEQHPDFAPAIKLKGMLLEEAGRPAEAAATYEEALKLAPNDGDLLLKTSIYKLTAGEQEEALRLLQRCIRILPGDGDAEYYLAQAYHLNGQDELALHAIRQSLKAEPDNVSVWQKYGELQCRARNSIPARRRDRLATAGDRGREARQMARGPGSISTHPHIQDR